MRKPKLLKKELGLWDVYVIATGATLSSGFFLLPGLAAVGAGPGIPLSYLLAGLLLVPGLVSMAELATAMPRTRIGSRESLASSSSSPFTPSSAATKDG